MYFNPPQPGNNPANPFWHPLNQNLNEENRLTGMDQDEALKIYNKLKKGSEIEVQFGNAISSGGKPITLKVTSGHRVVGKSRVGRIILINPENPRGMKYKLFNRDGRISLAQSDMATILKSMKILKEDVQLDEKVKTAFDDFDMDTRAFLAKLKKFGFEKEYKKMIMNFNKHANSGDGFYFIDGGRELGFQVHPVADMMMGPKIKKLGDTQDLGGGKTVRLIAIKENVQLDEKKKPISTRLGDAFDSGELEDRIKSMSGPARKSFMNLANSLTDFYHSMSDIHQVDGRQLEDKIDASPPRVRKMFAKLLDEDVQLDESSLPAYDARLLRQALVLGKNAFKAGKKREPIKDKNLVSLRGFAKGKGKNEVMKQWLKGWDEENLKEDVQLNEEVIKARVAFFGRPNKNNADMRDAKKKNMFVDAKDVSEAKGKMFDVTFNSRRQFNRFESEYDFLMVKVFEDVQVNEEKSLFDISPTSSKWMKGRLKTGYNQSQKSGMPKEVFKKGQVIDLHPFDGDRFVGAKSPKDKGSYFFVAKRNVDAMNESVQLGESFEFQFPTKKIAQNFMREISQEGLGSSTGTSDGQVTTTTHSGRVGEPTMAHMKMARIMKRYSGKLVRTTEGPRMAKIFEATTPLRKKVAAAKAKLKKAGIASAFQFGELYVHDKDLKKAMSIIGGDRDLLLVGQPMPLTKDDLMDGI